MSRLVIILFFFISNSSYALVDTAEVNQLYRAALIYNSKQDYKNVVNVLRKAKDLDPGNSIIRRDLALGYYNMKRTRDAKTEIDSCLRLQEPDPSCYILAVKIYSVYDEYKEALAKVTEGIFRYPENGELYYTKAELLYNFNKPEKAFELLQYAVNKAPDAIEIYYQLAKLFSKDSLYCIHTIFAGEQFLLNEAFTIKSAEIKKIVAESHRILYALIIQNQNVESLNDEYVTKIFQILKRSRFAISPDLKIKSLYEVRSNLLEDYQLDMKDFGCSLVSYWNYLEEQNLFEAYMVWLLGSYIDPAESRKWMIQNSDRMNRLNLLLTHKKIVNKSNEYYFKTIKYEAL
jgi:hypothetical protein